MVIDFCQFSVLMKESYTIMPKSRMTASIENSIKLYVCVMVCTTKDPASYAALCTVFI
jgi:hypothetical protein